jgi:hypothetical protein
MPWRPAIPIPVVCHLAPPFIRRGCGNRAVGAAVAFAPSLKLAGSGSLGMTGFAVAAMAQYSWRAKDQCTPAVPNWPDESGKSL